MADKTVYAIKQGDSFRHSLVFQDMANQVCDLSGYTAYAQVRKKPGGTLVASMGCTTFAEEGKLVISLTSAQTALIAPDMYEWDVRIAHAENGTLATIYEAILDVRQAVTEV